MKIVIALIVALLVTLVAANDRPKTYFVGAGPGRAVQKQAQGFAIYNETSQTWEFATPLNPSGTVNGIVMIGGGVLAYGGFNGINGKPAAGLAYYSGGVWCAPESVGLYNYNQNVQPYVSMYDNPPTGTGIANAAVVEGNDVYILGTFNQVGLTRVGVAGFVRLTWANGAFSVNRVGNGYFQALGNVPCPLCARGSQPPLSSNNMLKRYTLNNQVYYVVNSGGDLYQYPENGSGWTRITSSNRAVALAGNVVDYDIAGTTIFVVGKFENLEVSAAARYINLAQSTDGGASWGPVVPQDNLPTRLYGDVPAQLNSQGQQVFPALSTNGFTAIAAESATSLYIAVGYRIMERNVSVNILAGQQQTRVIRVQVGATNPVSLVGVRFGPGTPVINTLTFNNGVLYAYGAFNLYNQVTVPNGNRFSNRYTQVMRYAAKMENMDFVPALGGFLTGDNVDNFVQVPSENQVTGMNGVVYLIGTFSNSYESLSGGIFAYDGSRNNETKRWHPVLSNYRFTRIGANVEGTAGTVRAALVTQKKDALLIGGEFDFIGNQRISCVAAYTPDDLTVRSLGGGLYQYNNNPTLHGDDQFNNRVSGRVNDLEEKDNYVYAAGLFNRNNTGSCLANIARYEFRRSGRGWEPLDGGCNGEINDILFAGSLLIVTGNFDLCGRDPAAYDESPGLFGESLFRGRVPTDGIAVLNTDDDYDRQSWRPIGVGLQGGEGRALALYKGDLYVGGTFNSAGGKIATSGIARFGDGRWKDVVADCRAPCDRPVNVAGQFMQDAIVPTVASRKPARCDALGVVQGKLYCVTGNNELAWYTPKTWRRAGTFTVTEGTQNSVLLKNDSESDFLIVKGTSNNQPNDNNYITWHTSDWQQVPSHTGFTSTPNTFAAASSLTVSFFLLFICIIVYLM